MEQHEHRDDNATFTPDEVDAALDRRLAARGDGPQYVHFPDAASDLRFSLLHGSDWERNEALARMAAAATELVSCEGPKGVTLWDFAIAYERGDRDDAKRTITRLHGSKLLSEPIGECPRDSRASLYRLAEIFAAARKVLLLDRRLQDKLAKHLTRLLREPSHKQSA